MCKVCTVSDSPSAQATSSKMATLSLLFYVPRVSGILYKAQTEIMATRLSSAWTWPDGVHGVE